jgi:ribosome-binding protein aMBF1 (putative translation factor)
MESEAMTKRRRRRHAKTSDALEILDRMIGKDQGLRESVAEARLSTEIAEMIYRERIAAGLTQVQLARRVRTTQSVISRLEDADYEGHSLAMLQRIGKVLGRRLEVRFVPTVA